ncbi:hypothetical protein [Sulfidibacter corallicola]|uniref:Uncharacterized protein n=1 Tax=Sulfidibacter corallicola TaxID=2818388 RepID=A0A8A4TJG0_SULCO|nr:hypothetical protein [Sulfidibacter corallicola]QTD50169.1 hypothetical protein J3U87_31680 [Sulfidibacter corallicola]
MKYLNQIELARHHWAELREASGIADNIPSAILELLKSSRPDEAENAYWKIENHVVVQGQLFESAEYVVPVLLTSLLQKQQKWVKISILELLFQIVSGEPHEEEISKGNRDLGERCREKAREGLWILYQEMMFGERYAAKDVLEVIEKDPHRLSSILMAFDS